MTRFTSAALICLFSILLSCSPAGPISGTVGDVYPDSVVATVSVGDAPWDICALPSGEYLYVTNRNGVSVIRTSDCTVETTIDVGTFSSGICSLPSGEHVYVLSGDCFSIIRTSDNTVVGTVDLDGGTEPVSICSGPSGEYVYITNFCGDDVTVIH